MAEQQEPNKKGNPVVKLVNNRNFLVFIAFVVLSSFLWFLNYLNKNLTSEITIKYKLKNVPKTINEESSHGGELFVMASGQGYNLLQESLKTRNLPLSIDLESKAQDNRQLLKYASSRGKAYIISSDLKPLLLKKVGEKINIGEIKPDTLFFNLIDVREKKVPIETANIGHKLLDGQKITYLIGVYKLDFNATSYLVNTWNFMQPMDVISGLVKAAVFGFIITLMGCYNGFYSKGGAQGVGAATTNAVVSSSILILIFNYIITEIFFQT